MTSLIWYLSDTILRANANLAIAVPSLTTLGGGYPSAASSKRTGAAVTEKTASFCMGSRTKVRQRLKVRRLRRLVVPGQLIAHQQSSSILGITVASAWRTFQPAGSVSAYSTATMSTASVRALPPPPVDPFSSLFAHVGFAFSVFGASLVSSVSCLR